MSNVGRYIELKKAGLTYREIAEQYGTSKDAVRNVLRRHNYKTYGSYTVQGSFTPKDSAPTKDMKILILDVEAAPATAWVWQARTEYVPMSQLLETNRIICWAAKWLDGPTMFSSEWDHGRESMLRAVWRLLDEADIVITYNGDNYDIPFLNWEFKQMGINRYRPFKSIDLIKTVRKHFRPMYKKLDFLAQSILGERKIDNGGIQLWKDLLIDGLEPAKKLMREYNKTDVTITEDLYLDLLEWIDNHPPVKFSEDEVLCRACGSDDLIHVGWKTALLLRYPMYKCTKCNSFSRTTKGRERITNMYGV